MARLLAEVWVETITDAPSGRLISKVNRVSAGLNTCLCAVISVIAVCTINDTYLVGNVSIQSWVGWALCNASPCTIVRKRTWRASRHACTAAILSEVILWAYCHTEVSQIICEASPIRAICYALSRVVLSVWCSWASEHAFHRRAICVCPWVAWTICYTTLCWVISKGFHGNCGSAGTSKWTSSSMIVSVGK